MNWPSFSAASTPSIRCGLSHAAAQAEDAHRSAANAAITERNQFTGFPSRWLCQVLLVQNRHRPRPSRRRTMHLHRKAHHVEPVGWQQFEIVQLLKMRIADL